jgi:hypothetical protein
LQRRAEPQRDDPLRHRERASDDIEDWYPSREKAEATLAEILRDEPRFDGDLWVEAVEFELALSRPGAGGSPDCARQGGTGSGEASAPPPASAFSGTPGEQEW